MEANQYLNTNVSALVKTGPGTVAGFLVTSTSGGTIRFYDNTAGSGTVITEVITPAIGWHELGNLNFNVGLYATIAPTIAVTIIYK